jgi:ubiquinone/menaquinone biosynthesis C-methylase UbiE
MHTGERVNPNEYYTGRGVQWFLSQRTAETAAGFLMPHLRQGMRVLDCGCGPATITVGLAAAVAPGEVVGIDLAPVQVERARAFARKRDVGNLRFDVGDVTALGFDDAEFDAVFASNVLQYLPEPLGGLREIRRVLRPGGVVGLLDADVSTTRVAPDSPFTREFLPLFFRWREQGASPYYAPQQRPLLRRAGFVSCQTVTYTETLATPEATHALAEGLVEILSMPSLVALAAQNGWADEKLEELSAGARAWGEDPDALWTAIQFGAVGWAP